MTEVNIKKPDLVLVSDLDPGTYFLDSKGELHMKVVIPGPGTFNISHICKLSTGQCSDFLQKDAFPNNQLVTPVKKVTISID